MTQAELVRTDGTYDCVPLIKDSISLCVVQSRIRAVDAQRRDAAVKENLDHLLGLIDAANGWLGPKDIVFFHEFPLTGFDPRWRRADLLKVADRDPRPGDRSDRRARQTLWLLRRLWFVCA